MEFRKVREERENGGAGSEEVVDWDSHGRSWFHGGSAEEVDYEGFDGGGLGDLGEGGGHAGSICFDEGEGSGGEADGGCGGEWDVGEAEEGDGGMCGGDAADVVFDGWVVEEAGGEDDGDGETVRLDELGKFNHGYNVAYARCWKQYNCVLFHFG